MAEIKKTITTLGQRVTGLSAGNQYVFTLQKPNLRPDLENARRATRIAHQQVVESRKLVAALRQGREEAKRGNLDGARQILDDAKKTYQQTRQGLEDARDFAKRAVEDAKDVHKDVKNAYEAGKESAENAVAFAEKILGSIPDTLRAFGAYVQEAITRGS